MGSGQLLLALYRVTRLYPAVYRRETRPKILWNTGKQLETARLPEGTVAPISTTGEFLWPVFAVLLLRGTVSNRNKDFIANLRCMVLVATCAWPPV
jgi:archaeosine-15-forming tRNA-guanine transglycosylase